MSAIEVFISYSHKDENLREELEKHLKVLQRQGVIKSWSDRNIPAGSEWEKQILKNLQRAQIILLLVSADFNASDYCQYNEVNQAMEQHKTGDSIVVPVILRTCDWESMPYGKLQAVPKEARPVTSRKNQDEAFAEIAKAIRKIAEGLKLEISGTGLETPIRINRKFRSLYAIKRMLFRSKTISALSIFTITVLSIFIIYGLSAHSIINRFLEKADYSAAFWQLPIANLFAFYDGRINKILESLHRPLDLQAQLTVKNPDGLKWEYPAASNGSEKIKITPKDDYRLSVTLKQGSAYLYIFQIDFHYGRIQKFFPNPEFSEDSNPIQRNLTYNVPSGHWFYLEEHDSESITETTKIIYIIGSPWRASDIELLFEKIYDTVNGKDTPLKERKALIENFVARMSLRKESKIYAIYYREFVLSHSS
jgi:hypothetical protein